MNKKKEKVKTEVSVDLKSDEIALKWYLNAIYPFQI